VPLLLLLLLLLLLVVVVVVVVVVVRCGEYAERRSASPVMMWCERITNAGRYA
jgi:hypothetical protein